MSIFEFEGGSGSGRSWNATKPGEPGYTPQITGDVVELAEVQALDYNTKKPVFWPEGNPKLNVRMTLMQADGTEIDWTFSPGGRGDRASAAMKAVRTALQNAGFPGVSLTEIAGCNITVVTQDGVYNNSHPRPWGVQINGKGNSAYRGVKKFQPQAQQPQPQQPVMQAPLQQQVAQNPGMQAAMDARAAHMAAQQQMQQATQQPVMPVQPQQPVASQQPVAPEYPSVYDEYYDYNPNA